MGRMTSRRTIVAALTSIALVALSAAQVFAGGGMPPFPR